jgi:hypothetical protein
MTIRDFYRAAKPILFFLIAFFLSACAKSASDVPKTPLVTTPPMPTPTCYIVLNMTSAAIYQLQLTPIPDDFYYDSGQLVETAVTGGYTKWDKIQICGDEQSYPLDIERPITILLAEQPVVEFNCVAETCPITFTIPGQTQSGRAKLTVQSGSYSAEYNIWIREPETPSP